MASLVQCDMVPSIEMTRRIPPPQSQPQQSVNIAIGRGSPPPGHDQIRWVVVDSAGKRLHDDDLTWPAAWKLKEQLAGGRKVVSPRIEQAESMPPPVVAPVGVPPGVPGPRTEQAGLTLEALKLKEREQITGEWSAGITDVAGITNVADEDLPEVAAGVLADDELDDMLKDIG